MAPQAEGCRREWAVSRAARANQRTSRISLSLSLSLSLCHTTKREVDPPQSALAPPSSAGVAARRGGMRAGRCKRRLAFLGWQLQLQAAHNFVATLLKENLDRSSHTQVKQLHASHTKLHADPAPEPAPQLIRRKHRRRGRRGRRASRCSTTAGTYTFYSAARSGSGSASGAGSGSA